MLHSERKSCVLLANIVLASGFRCANSETPRRAPLTMDHIMGSVLHKINVFEADETLAVIS